MAQFRATISGQHGKEASRIGSKNSGIVANVNGWNAGVRVVASHVDGVDVFTVYRTGGSNGAVSDRTIAHVVENDNHTSELMAVEMIAELMSGDEWWADTLDAIADIVRLTGREIADSEVDA